MKIEIKEQIFPLEAPPTPACHASTIVAFDGTLYAAWFGGTREGHDDVGIWLSRREDDTWSEPDCMTCGDVPHWNPVLFPLGDRLFLYYKKGKPIPDWYTCYRFLEAGQWSGPQVLVPGDKGGRGPVKNKPILMKNGTVCAPASFEYKLKPLKGQKWQAFADLSEDGIHWRAQKPITASVGLIQPAIWESDAGLHALLRSDAGAVYRSDSRDGGVTWSRAHATSLPNNNSGIDVVADQGKLYVVYNPVGKNWGPRTPLAVSMSRDNGQTWDETITLETAEREYSYPSMVAADGALHVVYTHQRLGVAYVKLTI